MRRRFLLPAALLLASALPAQPPATSSLHTDTPPPVAREFRGVWIATVSNIDWPSRPGLSIWQQQVELLEILNKAVELNLNAIVLQVRPAGDALYRSRYEPWSEYLTGQMGKAPEPLYDPLAFAVQEAHKRGLELHAWFNPYRAYHPSATAEFSTNHISKTHPRIVRQYGKYLWLDPGESAVQRHSIRVILDVVRRYDIDGVHIDDYFYPYKERDSTGNVIEFPDDSSWARYARAGGKLGRDDWRRRNVDRFVQQLYRGIKAQRPGVKFGISPFGIWRPGHPEQITGFDAYEQLYADSRKWLEKGWVDYFTPQLYWAVGDTAHSYPALLKWWVEQNKRARHIWPGNFTSRVGSGDERTWSAGELLDQIRVTREQPGASGNIHFSVKALMQNREGLAEQLRMGAYSAPALVPASPWLGRRPPGRPRAIVQADPITGGTMLHVRPAAKQRAWLWVVRAKHGGAWVTVVLPGWQRSHTLTRNAATALPEMVVVSAVDRAGNEGPLAVMRPVVHWTSK